MPDPSVRFPETAPDKNGVERIVAPAGPNYIPAPAGLTDRQRANAERRQPQPAASTPIVPAEHPAREATV